MAEYIDGTPTNETPSAPYAAKIPSYEDAADIKDALKLYHYGTSIIPTTEAGIDPLSVAGYFKSLDNRVDVIEAKDLGSIVSGTMPTGVEDGYIWLDSSTLVTTNIQYAQAVYETTAPVSPTKGTLWVDSDSSPLTLYVYSGTEWKAIGA